MLEAARPHDHDVEANPQPTALRMPGEPRLRGVPHPADLLGVHHLERITESRAGFALHLTEVGIASGILGVTTAPMSSTVSTGLA
jgi:hypothetical protein